MTGDRKQEWLDKTVRLDRRELMYSLYTKQTGLWPQSFLECTEGAETGRRFLISEHNLILGRSHECNIRLEDPLVSGRHASIAREGDQFVLEDLGSSNGVFVNGEKVKRAMLANNDEIRIGGCRFLAKLTS